MVTKKTTSVCVCFNPPQFELSNFVSALHMLLVDWSTLLLTGLLTRFQVEVGMYADVRCMDALQCKGPLKQKYLGRLVE